MIKSTMKTSFKIKWNILLKNIVSTFVAVAKNKKLNKQLIKE